MVARAISGLPRAGGTLIGPIAINVDPGFPATGSNECPLVVGTATRQSVNRALIETDATLRDIGGGTYQGAVPLQINQWGGGTSAPAIGHFEPLCFFRSNGTNASPVAVTSGTSLGLIQYSGDTGAGSSNDYAVNVLTSVSPLYAVASGIVPGRYEFYITDGSGNHNLAARWDADTSTTFFGNTKVNGGTFTVQIAGQVLPQFLNSTQVSTTSNVGALTYTALDSNGSQADFGAILVQSNSSVTHGSHTGVLALRVAQGGSLVTGLSVTGSASSTAVSSPGSITARSSTAIPAGGTAGAGLLVSSTSNFGVFFGSGAPTLSAAQGSLYIRSDGNSTSTRLYVNTNGSTTWTNVTTAA